MARRRTKRREATPLDYFPRSAGIHYALCALADPAPVKAQIEALRGLYLWGIRPHRVWLRFLRSFHPLTRRPATEAHPCIPLTALFLWSEHPNKRRDSLRKAEWAGR